MFVDFWGSKGRGVTVASFASTDCRLWLWVRFIIFITKVCVLTFLRWLETDRAVDGGAFLIYLKLCVMFTSVSYRKFFDASLWGDRAIFSRRCCIVVCSCVYFFARHSADALTPKAGWGCLLKVACLWELTCQGKPRVKCVNKQW